MDGDFVSTFRGVLDGNPMDHGEVPKIFQQIQYMLMMDAWNTSYKFLKHVFECDYGSWERMMRANAVKAGRRALEGEPQRGSGLYWVWWWSPSSVDPDSSKKLSWRQLEFPNEGGARVQTQWS